MKKKDTVARPQPAQTDAIRRALHDGRVGEAREKLARLRRQFPNFKPLFPLAYEIEAETGNAVGAAMAAWDWSLASPNSEAAWQALGESAGMTFPALSLYAWRQAKSLAGEAPVPEPEGQQTPFGPLSFDESRRMDMCRMFLSHSRFDEAEAAITGIEHVSARNNLALVYFGRGRVGEALEQVERCWQEAPENIFALERVIRLRLWTGGLDRAAGLGETLVRTTPRRTDDARAKLIGLLLLDRFDDAEACLAECLAGVAGEEAPDELNYLGAYAAWRRGDVPTTLSRLKEAKDYEMASEVAEQLVLGGFSGEPPNWLIGDIAGWWPLESLNRLRDSGSADEDALVRLLELLTPHVEYLGRMAEQAGQFGPVLAGPLLKARALAGDAAALAELRSLLARPCGPDRVRSEVHSWLAEQGFLHKGETSRLLTGGKVHEVAALSMRIVAEPNGTTDMPPEDEAAYEEAVDLLRAAKTEDAHAIMTRLADKHPDKPRILANLAAIRASLKHLDEEVESLARRAHALDPDYLFGRTHLARILARRGEIGESTTLIAPLHNREEMHISEWIAYTQAQAEVAKARGDIQNAFRLLQSIKDMSARFGD
jgi:tetratricopeptide (TPR) repeat protein